MKKEFKERKSVFFFSFRSLIRNFAQGNGKGSFCLSPI